MTEQHPITPSHELVEQWFAAWNPYSTELSRTDYVATEAARWGADQELEACCELTRDNDGYDAALGLRAARRPKPPSLQEEALAALDKITGELPATYEHIIRRALEQINDSDAPVAQTVQTALDTGVKVQKSGKKANTYRRHLDAATVKQIKTAVNSGMSKKIVAIRYGVHYSTVLKIARGSTYTNVVV